MTGRRFLVPLDFEESSMKALRWCTENILQPSDQLFLFSVIDSESVNNSTAIELGEIVPPLSADPLILKKELDAVQNCTRLFCSYLFRAYVLSPFNFFHQANESMKQAVESMRQWYQGNDLTDIQVQCMVEIIDADSVGDRIHLKVVQLKPDAVVMGTHNNGIIKEFFLGSVTNQVMSATAGTPPVIIIHANK